MTGLVARRIIVTLFPIVLGRQIISIRYSKRWLLYGLSVGLVFCPGESLIKTHLAWVSA